MKLFLVCVTIALLGFFSLYIYVTVWNSENAEDAGFWQDVSAVEDEYIPPEKVFIDSEPAVGEKLNINTALTPEEQKIFLYCSIS